MIVSPPSSSSWCLQAEVVVNYHVGETVLSLQKTTLIPGGSESLVYTTLSGGIGILVPFTSHEVMSQAATRIAPYIMFSRTFTNVSVLFWFFLYSGPWLLPAFRDAYALWVPSTMWQRPPQLQILLLPSQGFYLFVLFWHVFSPPSDAPFQILTTRRPANKSSSLCFSF